MVKSNVDLYQLSADHAGVPLQVNAYDLELFGRKLIAATLDEAKREKFLAASEHLEPLLDANEVKAMLKVQDITLYRWAKKAYLSPIIVGGKKLYRLSDINQIINQSK